MNYKLKISYDGTNFCGWQTQRKDRTVQNDIENALSKIFADQSIKLIGSGRTDSGVHAINQVANFWIDTKMHEEEIRLAVNSHLKNDIYINECKIIEEDFHARYSAKKREYYYNISTFFSPFNRRYSWLIRKKIEKNRLNECSHLIKGIHDFSNFCKTSSLKKNNQCEIFDSRWEFTENGFCYFIKSNRFLHHMIRMLVGTMIEVGRDKIKINDFKNLTNNKNKFSVVTAPSHGLFLSNVYYK